MQVEIETENSRYSFLFFVEKNNSREFLKAKGKRIGTNKTHIKVFPLAEVTYAGEVVQCKKGESLIIKGEAGIKTSKIISIHIVGKLVPLNEIRNFMDVL